MDDKKKNGNKKLSYVFTRETMGMTLMLFCAIVLLMLFTRETVFAGIGTAICTFMYGTFGYGSWLVLAALAYLGEWLVFEKKIKLSFLKTLSIALTAFVVFLLFHSVTTGGYALEGYGKYISDCYTSAANGWSGYTFGGVLSALFTYPLMLISPVAAYVILAILTLVCGYFTFRAFKGKRSKSSASEVIEVSEAEVVEESTVNDGATEIAPVAAPVAVSPTAETVSDGEYYEDEEKYSRHKIGRKILFDKGEFAAESYRRNMIFNEDSYFNKPAALASEADYLSSFSSDTAKPASTPAKTYTESYREDVYSKPATPTPASYVYGDKPATDFNGYGAESGSSYSVSEAPAYETPKESVYEEESFEPYVEEEKVEIYDYEEHEGEESSPVQTVEPVEEPPYVPPVRERTVGFGESAEREQPAAFEEKQVEKSDDGDKSDIFGAQARDRRSEGPIRQRSVANLFDDDSDEEDVDVFGRTTRETPSEPLNEPRRPVVEPVRKERELPVQPAPQNQEPVQEEKPKHVWKKYVRPSLDLLDDYPENSNVNTGEIEDNKRIIVETLERFKIECEISNVTIGPAITRYDVIILDKTNIKRSLNYRDAIAMELRKENVTAYLNYSKGALSIEVPNEKRTVVGLKSMLASPKFINCKPNSLTFGLGKNVEGDVVCPDITKMPHLLVAGTTGSGKSICLSSLLISLLYKYGPEELRMILVDPKQVEFISYDKLPHLMINEILYEVDKAIKALNWAIKEMERRYTLFKDMTEAGKATKNLDEYNAHLPEGEEKLPKILIVLDEFGDLMLQAKKDIESRIIKLVQKARACGIHLILATQRPSVDCITGLIKSNLPTRIGFKVNSFDDARTIFDIGGAEKLLGRGDMYFRSAENPDLTRIQGCFVDTHEVQKVTDFVKANNETFFDQSVSDFINTVEQEETPARLGGVGDGEGDGGEDGEIKIDDTHIKALKYCVMSNQASVSMIQRRFPVGYIKACKIIDWMENMNYITPSEGSKPRKVLLSKEEFINIFGDEVDD